ncbi:hypothetical protein BpHYR1_005987 [Brachionus plicatilis]|uniref:Uncharacterized protein n=1 Tax=Brachionus plicatilis TaxID=10195 RepID=A0A3M7SWE8_BRAPC|nr:hypothetical protein BpHYR1_005987 [Brachionus plicatilis]
MRFFFHFTRQINSHKVSLCLKYQVDDSSRVGTISQLFVPLSFFKKISNLKFRTTKISLRYAALIISNLNMENTSYF